VRRIPVPEKYAAAAGLFEELASDWLLFDAEIMPLSAKASALIEQQYAAAETADRAGPALESESIDPRL